MDSPDAHRRGSGLTAVAVVIGAVLVWWLFSGNGPQGPPGNDPRLLIPDGAATPSVGTEEATEPSPASGTVRVRAYETDGDRLHLWLDSAIGSPSPSPDPAPRSAACDRGERPRVLESEVSVIVTVSTATAACVVDDQGLWLSLGSPLGDRAVLDGSLSPPRRVVPR